jgi:lipocalin
MKEEETKQEKLPSPTAKGYNTLEVVPHVELKKYLGKWCEIAHLPARFQEGCSETTATYSLLENGSISVLNPFAILSEPNSVEYDCGCLVTTTYS